MSDEPRIAEPDELLRRAMILASDLLRQRKNPIPAVIRDGGPDGRQDSPEERARTAFRAAARSLRLPKGVRLVARYDSCVLVEPDGTPLALHSMPTRPKQRFPWEAAMTSEVLDELPESIAPNEKLSGHQKAEIAAFEAKRNMKLRNLLAHFPSEVFSVKRKNGVHSLTSLIAGPGNEAYRFFLYGNETANFLPPIPTTEPKLSKEAKRGLAILDAGFPVAQRSPISQGFAMNRPELHILEKKIIDALVEAGLAHALPKEHPKAGDTIFSVLVRSGGVESMKTIFRLAEET
jgi:hypothetical protein